MSVYLLNVTDDENESKMTRNSEFCVRTRQNVGRSQVRSFANHINKIT